LPRNLLSSPSDWRDYDRFFDVLIGSAVGAVALERCGGHKLKPLDCLGTNRSEVLLQQMAGRLAANPS
jgi:hypothetical protein